MAHSDRTYVGMGPGLGPGPEWVTAVYIMSNLHTATYVGT